MSTDEGTATTADDAVPAGSGAPRPTSSAAEPVAEPTADAEPEGRRDWWHRDHPTFAALLGFYTGLVTVIVLPGGFAALLAALVDTERAGRLYPLVLVVFAIPLALLVPGKTRRFARYMLFGMLLTAVVVLGTAAVVLWFLVRADR